MAEVAEKINSGKTPLGGEAIYTAKGILFIRSQNVNNDRLELENSVFIPEEINREMKNSIVHANDILLNITGASLGRSCVVPNDFKIGNVNQHVCIIRLHKEFMPRFIQPILSSTKGQNIFQSLQTGSGREVLYWYNINHILHSFPSLTEQQKIASFLSLIDERIDTQSKIIQRLETLIQGLREKLFTQRLRFKDEDGQQFPDWEVKKLGEIVEFYKGSSLSKGDISADGQIKCIHYGELFTIYEEIISVVVSRTNKGGLHSQVGDVLMPSSDVTPLGLATASVILESGVVLGGDINVLRPFTEINPVFLSYLLNYEKKKVIELVSGTTVKHIYSKDLKNIHLLIPISRKEQTYISGFLSAIGKKIETEKKILEQYKNQKKFLLQNLFI